MDRRATNRSADVGPYGPTPCRSSGDVGPEGPTCRRSVGRCRSVGSTRNICSFRRIFVVSWLVKDAPLVEGDQPVFAERSFIDRVDFLRSNLGECSSWLRRKNSNLIQSSRWSMILERAVKSLLNKNNFYKFSVILFGNIINGFSVSQWPPPVEPFHLHNRFFFQYYNISII